MSIDNNDATGINEDTPATDTVNAHAHATMLSFEDKLRQESILIPEDIEDIHIQSEATATATATATAGAATDATNNYGRGKHWKRNVKKKQQQQQQQQSTAVPHATERTIEQRREQVRPIVDKLTELQMNVSYPAIRELYKQISHFVKTGEDTKIKIAFPEFSRKIKGELSNAPYIPCWVKLEID